MHISHYGQSCLLKTEICCYNFVYNLLKISCSPRSVQIPDLSGFGFCLFLSCFLPSSTSITFTLFCDILCFLQFFQCAKFCFHLLSFCLEHTLLIFSWLSSYFFMFLLSCFLLTEISRSHLLS